MAEQDRVRALRLIGVLALIVGVVGGVVLWLFAARRYDDAVSALAPAPVGCDTTLVFDRTGTYTFFVETKGTVGEIDGDCDNDEREYDLDEAPRVELTLIDEDGEEIDLERAVGPTYDRAGAVGEGVRTAEIEIVGDYVLTARSEDADVMVRVGRDPANGVTAMRLGAVAVLVAGLVVGIITLWRGRSRWSIPADPTGPVGGWAPRFGPPPVAPPYANPPRPPPYATPPGQPLPPPSPPPPRR